MKNDCIELFVPGRLCVLGEHSDWASKYRTINPNIELGYAIVTGIEEGIYATVKRDNKLLVYIEEDNKKFIIDMNKESLLKVAQSGNFWSYIAGVAYIMKEKYDVSGLNLKITKQTLPKKKGLSSSAAICVLVARAFNKLYDLKLSVKDEMNLAYMGEIITPSKCGKLDQACAYGKKPVLMVFDGSNVDVSDIKVKEDLYFVFADLMSNKNTIKILSDLNESYPYPQNVIQENVVMALGELNKNIIYSSLECIKEGNIKGLGKLMIKAQEIFDQFVSPASQELKSVILHKTLNDDYLKNIYVGAKGIGSQGDGSIQFLAENKEKQLLIYDYLKNKLNMKPYLLTINKTNLIRKAVIPIAGNGVRMYPISKVTRKAILPILDNDGILKPAILCLLEELINSGIEEIALIIDRSDKPYFDQLFSSVDISIKNKLSDNLLSYEKILTKIGQNIKYIYQDEKLGLGHALYLASDFASNEPVLLVLGDQLYESNINKTCTSQLLENYNNKLTVSVSEVPLNNVNKYGILSGKIKNNNNFNVLKIVEKPSSVEAYNNLYTLVNNQKKYYAFFGEYIITPKVFTKLKYNIEHKIKENGEYQLTSVLEEIRKEEEIDAFIPDGRMFDIGNVEDYTKTLKYKIDKNS